MGFSPLKCFVNCSPQPDNIQTGLLNQKNQIHQVSHTGVFTTVSRHGVGVNFFGKLFLGGNRRELCRRYASKPQPVSTGEKRVWLAQDVAGADIQMKFRKRAPGQSGLDRKPRTTIRSRIQVLNRFTDQKSKVVP